MSTSRPPWNPRLINDGFPLPDLETADDHQRKPEFKRSLSATRQAVVVDTFVVRIYPAGEDEPQGLRGVVSQVASGETMSFTSADELFAFLVDPLGGRGIAEEVAH